MKKIWIVLIAFMSFSASYKAEAQVPAGISFNTFYNELSPYGRWVNYPGYGQVWIADQQGFEPYYDNGHWVFTSYGWTWVSDYSWGWAPFHYGRWAYTSYGWAWVPGYEWAPAWVGWCQNDGYYGWAPLSPGLGFNISFNNIPRNRWRFVQQQYITSPAIRNHYIRPERNGNVYKNVTIINNTQVVNNNTYIAGPGRQDVEKATRQKIEPKQVAFNETSQKTQVEKKQVKMYRPDTKQSQAAVKPADPVKATEPVKNIPAVPQQDDKKAAAIERQKTEQDAIMGRQDAEEMKQGGVVKPVISQKENEKQLPATGQNIERQDAVKQQKVQQQQEVIQQQKAQEQKDVKPAAPQQDLQKQNEIRQQKMPQQELIKQQQVQEQKNQQLDLQRQDELKQQQLQQQKMQGQRNQQQLEREQELRQQKIQQQRDRQQQMQEQRNQQEQAAQQRRVQQQNEVRQQRVDIQQKQQQQPTQPVQQKPQQKERAKSPF